MLNAALRGVSLTIPPTVYIALYVSDPTAADTGAEVVGGGYARRAIAFTVPALENGLQTVKNSADIEFPIATSTWGLVTHIGLRTAATGGNLLFFDAVDNPRTTESGDKLKLLRDSVVARFTN